jgi:hypothetical protein
LRRLFLFVDYQNAYMHARRCFADASASGVVGQFDPVALGELVARKRRTAGWACELDSDLVPALEAVLELSPSTHVEVACWEPARGSTVRLRVPGRSVWCHYLTAADYAAVADTRNYART